jgi:hypothetical protein
MSDDPDLARLNEVRAALAERLLSDPPPHESVMTPTPGPVRRDPYTWPATVVIAVALAAPTAAFSYLAATVLVHLLTA